MRELPELIPEDVETLDEVIMLLGHLASDWKALKKSKQDRCRELLGDLPTSKKEATLWKSALKGYRKELVELDHEEPG